MYYKVSKKVKVLKEAKLCYFTQGNRFEECAREFILSGPFPNGELKAISDVESFSNTYAENNKWIQKF